MSAVPAGSADEPLPCDRRGRPAAQSPGLRVGDPARPPCRRGRPAGGRARLAGGRRPSRLPACGRSRAAPSTTSTPTATPASSTPTRRPSAAWSATSTEAVGDAGAEWEDRAVAATQALLSAWEADRVLAHLCLVAAVGGNGEALALRRAAIAQIAALLADAPAQPLAAEPVLAGAIGGVWGLAFSSLTENPETSIAELAGTAIYLRARPVRRPSPGRGAGGGSRRRDRVRDALDADGGG